MERDVDIRELSDADLIRAVADGEVSREDALVRARLSGIGGVESRLEFERGLRSSVGRAMGGGAVPSGLRERVVSALAAEGGVAAGLDLAAGDTRERSFWRRASRFAAMAAMLALVGFVLVRGQSMTGSLPGSQRSQLISFVFDAHNDCERCEVTRGRRLPADCVEKACDKADAVLGRRPAALDAAISALDESGIAFAGLGECNMPGDGGAVQLLFRRAGEDYTSLFIQRDLGALSALAPDCAYGRQRCRVKGDQLTVWRHDGFVYYLYTASPGASEALKSAFGTPTHRRAL